MKKPDIIQIFQRKHDRNGFFCCSLDINNYLDLKRYSEWGSYHGWGCSVHMMRNATKAAATVATTVVWRTNTEPSERYFDQFVQFLSSNS